MNWTELLETEAAEAYHCAESLLNLVDDADLDWKPAQGSNWMTTGQLLHHISEACGKACQGFITGDWGMPEGVDPANMPPEAMMPPAESLPAADSVDAARRALAADRELAGEMFAAAAERMEEPTPAPWDPRPTPLGRRLLSMIDHLNTHKAQLYYYLKLQGKAVNTLHLYGMAPMAAEADA